MTANAPWRVPAKYSNCVRLMIENRLRERVAVVEVQERLVRPGRAERARHSTATRPGALASR